MWWIETGLKKPSENLFQKAESVGATLVHLPILAVEEIPFEIDVPNITHKEALHLNKIINIEKEETDFIEQKIISPTDLEKYKRFYKYMPNFYDVRL